MRAMGCVMVLAAAAVFLGGCSTAERRVYELEVPDGVRLLAVDIENFAGRVEVRADKGGDGIRIESRVDGSSEATGAEKRAIAERVRVEAEVEEFDGRAVLRIRTATSAPGSADSVSLWVRTPRCDGLRVINEGGDVEAVGTGGSTYIENRFGAIEVRTARPVTEDVTLLNVDGNIYLQTAPGSTGRIDLLTNDGEAVIRDFTGGTDETYAAGVSVTTTLVADANTVLARTNRGDVRMWVMEDPEALTRVYKKNLADPRDLLFLKGSRRHTRNLPDDAPR